jgi:hypothetical protein
MTMAAMSVVSLAIVAAVPSSPKVRYTFLAFGEARLSRVSAVGPRGGADVSNDGRRVGDLGVQSDDPELSVKHDFASVREACSEHRLGQVSEGGNHVILAGIVRVLLIR